MDMSRLIDLQRTPDTNLVPSARDQPTPRRDLSKVLPAVLPAVLPGPVGHMSKYLSIKCIDLKKKKFFRVLPKYVQIFWTYSRSMSRFSGHTPGVCPDSPGVLPEYVQILGRLSKGLDICPNICCKNSSQRPATVVAICSATVTRLLITMTRYL